MIQKFENFKPKNFKVNESKDSEFKNSIRNLLKDYAEEWDVFVGDQGKAKTKKEFRFLCIVSRDLKMKTTGKYPDGNEIDFSKEKDDLEKAKKFAKQLEKEYYSDSTNESDGFDPYEENGIKKPYIHPLTLGPDAKDWQSIEDCVDKINEIIDFLNS